MALHGSSPDVPTFAAFAQIVFTDVTGVIVGGSIPIPVEDRVTLVGTPNAFAHQRLMQAINNIVPDAGEPPKLDVGSVERALGVEHRGLLQRDPERDDDEGEPDHTLCRVVGGCE